MDAFILTTDSKEIARACVAICHVRVLSTLTRTIGITPALRAKKGNAQDGDEG
jgi:hypothetical protein